MADAYSRRDSWLDYLPGNVQQSINTNPILNALGRALNRPSPSLERGIDYDEHGNVADRNWLLQQAAGGPPKMNPLAAEMLDKGGTLAMFLGPAAKTADLKALVRAQTRTAAGVPREQVWREDGWFQGPDGKWRFEIDDSGSTKGWRNKGALGKVLKHETLYDAYPDAAQIPASPSPYHPMFGQQSSFYDPGTPRKWWQLRGKPERIGYQPPITDRISDWLDGGVGANQSRRHLLHEAQHAIQRREGFARGGGPLLSDDVYKRMAGEVEARAVQRRMDMSPDERTARPPWLDYDVPEAQQIVRHK